VGVKRGENDVQGMISSRINMIDPKMELVDGLPRVGGLVCSHWNQKEVAIEVIFSPNTVIAAIAPDRDKVQHARVPVRHRIQNHKGDPVKFKESKNNCEDWKKCGAGSRERQRLTKTRT
jgi:hypothetical protein